MNIYINVLNQRMVMSSACNKFVSGSQEFVKFQFNVGDEWQGLTMFAQFRQDGKAYNQYLDSDNCVYLPAEIKAGTCTIMLYGTGDTTIATTNYLTIKLAQDFYIEDADSTEISTSLYNQLVSKVAEYKASVDTVSGSLALKADKEALAAEISRAKNAEETNAAAIKALQEAVVPEDQIKAAVEAELAAYLESGKLAEMTIKDGSLSRSKVDADFESVLVKADNAQSTSNLVTKVSASSDNDHYPSAKAVYDFLGDTSGLAAQVQQNKEDIALLKHKCPVIKSFTVSPSTGEMGASINVTCTVVSDITVSKVEILKGDTVIQTVENDTTTTITANGVTATTVFTAKLTDDLGHEISSSKSINFYNGVYYGVGPQTISLNNLTKSLQATRSKTFTVTAGEDQYIYFACPSLYGTPTFKVAGFEGGFSLLASQSFTNSSGYTEGYQIWRSTNTNLGKQTIVVS